MPWKFNRDLLHMLTLRTSADNVAPRWDKYPEPLHAIYNKTCLPPFCLSYSPTAKNYQLFRQVQVRFVEREEIAV
ncbi:MAG: hypothetical protein R3E31_15025 [Chloroflexota bacterium]